MECNMEKNKNMFFKNGWTVPEAARLRNLEEKEEEILKENITFENFGALACHHIFVESHGTLRCINCGDTTLNYPLYLKEALWLVKSAWVKGLLVRNAKETDIPLLMQIKEMFHPTTSLEYEEILKKVKETNGKSYVSPHEGLHLILEAEEEKNKIQESILEIKNSSLEEETKERLIGFKNLAYEECITSQFEVLILEGVKPEELFKNAFNEQTKFLALKAYYNLSQKQFKKESGYFKTEEDIDNYIYLTVNKEMNQMILERKTRS